MSDETPRDLLAQADRERRVGEAAETARRCIRLSEKPVVRQGVLGFLGRRQGAPDYWATAVEVDALYRALGIVRDEALAAAQRYESRVRSVS